MTPFLSIPSHRHHDHLEPTVNNPTRSTSIRAQHPGESDHDYLYDTNPQYKFVIELFFELSWFLERMQRHGMTNEACCAVFSEQPLRDGQGAEFDGYENEHEYKYENNQKYTLLLDLLMEVSDFASSMDRERFTIAECRYAFAPPQFRAGLGPAQPAKSGVIR